MNAVDGKRVLTDLKSEYLNGAITADEYGFFDDAARDAMMLHAEAVLQMLYGSLALTGVTPEILRLQNAVQRLTAKEMVR